MRFTNYKRMTVAELRDILAQAIEILDEYPDNTKIIERSNTYGCPTPYLSTSKGFYPLNDLEFETDDGEIEENLNEKYGFVRKYRGCSIHDMGDVYVVTNENGLNIGEEKTEIGCEAIIDEYLDGKVDETLQKSCYVIKEDDGDGEYDKLFKRIFPFAAINDEQAYDFMYNIGKIINKWLVKDVAEDCFYLLKTILKKILRYAFGSDSDRSWNWIINKIDETVMRYFNDEDLGTRCMREVMDFIDREWI